MIISRIIISSIVRIIIIRIIRVGVLHCRLHLCLRGRFLLVLFVVLV